MSNHITLRCQLRKSLAHVFDRYTALEIWNTLTAMVKPMNQYTKDEMIFRDYLLEAYGNKTSEDEVERLLKYLRRTEFSCSRRGMYAYLD